MLSKNAIFSLFILLAALPCLSQPDTLPSPKTKQHEAGIVLYQGMVSTNHFRPFQAWQFFTNGFYWKYSRGKNAIKTTLAYQHTHLREDASRAGGITFNDYFSPYPYRSFTELQAAEVKFAYERLRSNTKKFSLYYLCELSYAFNRFRTVGGGGYAYVIEDAYHFISYGSLLGFRYLPHPRVVLGLETGVRVTLSVANVNSYWGENSDYGGIWLNLAQLHAGFRF